MASKISSVVLERFKADDEIASHTFEHRIVGRAGGLMVCIVASDRKILGSISATSKRFTSNNRGLICESPFRKIV